MEYADAVLTPQRVMTYMQQKEWKLPAQSKIVVAPDGETDLERLAAELRIGFEDMDVEIIDKRPPKITITQKPLARVSICVTHFNRPMLLAQQLESIRRQDVQPFEVVLVDDGSTDAAAVEYLRSLEREFSEKIGR